jgi:O-antigen/teichoic acid export membrane protein
MSGVGGSLKRLTEGSLVYGLGGMLARMIGFLLIPVYTRALTPEDYGVMALIGLATTIIGMVFQMGFNGAMIRFYHDYPESRRRVFFGSTFLFQMSATALASLAMALLSGPICRALFGEAALARYLVVSLAGSWLGLIGNVPSACFLIREQKWAVVGLSLFGTLVGAACPLYMVVALRMGVWGAFLGTLMGTAVSSALNLWLTIREIDWKFDWAPVKRALAFGLPLIPHLMSHWAISYFDRLLIQKFATTSEVGLYSLGYNFGLIMQLITGSINTAWAPFFYNINREKGEEQAKAEVAKLSTYWLMLVGLAAMSLASLGPEVLRLMAAPAFWGASRVVPLIVLSYFVHGMYFMAVNPIFYKERTRILPGLSGIAAAVNVGLNFLLVPRYGMMGAAWAAVAGFAVLFIMVLSYSRKFYRVPYEYGRGAAALLILAAAWLATAFIPIESPGTALLAKTGVCALALPALAFLVATRQERGRIANFVRRMLPGLA